MAYPAGFLKVTWGGKIGTTDIWANGLNFKFNASLWSNSDESFNSVNLDDVFNAVSDAYAKPGGLGIAPFVSLNWVKIAQIGTDGKYIGEARELYKNTGVTGDNAGKSRNYSDSLVVSLLTDKGRGAGSRGRLYPPPFGIVIADNGKIDAGTLEVYGNKFADLIKRLNTVFSNGADTTALNGNFGSAAVMSKVGSGEQNIIKHVSVGNIMDVQRRRRNRITETYVAATTDI